MLIYHYSLIRVGHNSYLCVNLFLFSILHFLQRTCKFSYVVSPPLLYGMMWSMTNFTPGSFSAFVPHSWQVALSLSKICIVSIVSFVSFKICHDRFDLFDRFKNLSWQSWQSDKLHSTFSPQSVLSRLHLAIILYVRVLYLVRPFLTFWHIDTTEKRIELKPYSYCI